jgi:hypothetical protein
MNRTYEAPKLTLVGSLEALTAATVTGDHLDANYPAGTHVPGPILS